VSPDSSGRPHLWLASLDPRTRARQLTQAESDNPCFAEDGTLFFRGVDGQFNFAYRMDRDASQHKAISEPIVNLQSCSPDGRWLGVSVALAEGDAGIVQVAYDLSKRASVYLCRICTPQWSRDGRILTVSFGANAYAIKLNSSMLPKLPSGQITAANVMTLPVVKTYQDLPTGR